MLLGSVQAQDTSEYRLGMLVSGPATEEVLIKDSVRVTPVILMVCDTTIEARLWWTKGYKVEIFVPDHFGKAANGAIGYFIYIQNCWKFSHYIDANKRSFNKNIIVWMAQ